ncbi:carcinoembryonic antigen-related cell adhesion molecule 1-like [Hyla sarda]|uniref:carcinoembryonic antigen-related cell adhesion molecule 1-like n=1 Tax=Hyla sarda TaxID=327740 RepID=UPI0024C41D30|nr:carcinoembryonic antigen-related cell adhesion molecule 1-like [Hyla sarda]
MRADIIAVLILHMDLISGKMHIQLNPQYPIVKESVMLSVTGIQGTIVYFTWFKGPNTSSEYQILTYMNGLEVRGKLPMSRVSAFSNGSLLITDLQVGDGGYYRVKVQTEKQEDTDVFLQVYENVSKPVITASHTGIRENDFVSLTCDSVNADRIVWIRSSSETINFEIGNIVKYDNGTIIFSNIKRSDEGNYECRAENLVSHSSSEVYTLTILREDNEPVTQEPYGSTSTSQNITASSDSKHASFHESVLYKSAGVTAGIICGTILGILLFVTLSFFLYKRYGPRRKKPMTGTPINGPESYAVYNNILDPTTELEPKNEPLYMCLDISSEGTYDELYK